MKTRNEKRIVCIIQNHINVLSRARMVNEQLRIIDSRVVGVSFIFILQDEKKIVRFWLFPHWLECYLISKISYVVFLLTFFFLETKASRTHSHIFKLRKITFDPFQYRSNLMDIRFRTNLTTTFTLHFVLLIHFFVSLQTMI